MDNQNFRKHEKLKEMEIKKLCILKIKSNKYRNNGTKYKQKNKRTIDPSKIVVKII